MMRVFGTVSLVRSCGLGVFALGFGFAQVAVAADKLVTYQDDVLPLLQNNCLKCHNPDKAKGDLNMANYSSLLKGSGSGVIVMAGDVDKSKLFQSITHTAEPNMPPNSPKIPDKEIDVFRRWIMGGLLETKGSKAIVSNKPAVDLGLTGVTKGKPDGPPPMPENLLLEPVRHAERATALRALAKDPWSPVVALGGHKQVVLYHSSTLDLLGVLPLPEGSVNDLKFSRNGKLLLAGVGRGGQSGKVVVWNVITGERVLTMGEEFDSVLAADISSDQTRIALGGPGKVVKVYSTKTGEMEHRITKHTDWITAIEFSPDSTLLATGDRNGGLIVWEASSGQELYTLNDHKTAITALRWRDDSDVLASASEDGSIKLWHMQQGNQVASWGAHGGGVLSLDYSHDGRILSCGRDNVVALWNGQGGKLRNMEFTGDLPTRVSFSHDGERAIASDWAGNVGVWNTADGKRVGELQANPPTIGQRIELATKRVADLQAVVDKAVATIRAMEAETALAAAGRQIVINLLITTNRVANPAPPANAKPVAKGKAVAPVAPVAVTNLVKATNFVVKTNWLVVTNQIATTNLVAMTNLLAAAKTKVTQAQASAAQATTNLLSAKAVVVKWEMAMTSATVYYAKAELAAFKQEHEKRLAEVKFAQEAGEKAAKDLAAAQKAHAVAEQKVKTLEIEVKKVAKNSAVPPVPKRVEKVVLKTKAVPAAASSTNQTAGAKTAETKPVSVAVAPPATNAPVTAVMPPKVGQASSLSAPSNAPVATVMAAKAAGQTTNGVAAVETPLETAQKALAKAKTDAAELEKRVASLTKLVKITVPARQVAAKLAVEKSTKELAANQARVDRLIAASAPKAPPTTGTKAAKL